MCVCISVPSLSHIDLYVQYDTVTLLRMVQTLLGCMYALPVYIVNELLIIVIKFIDDVKFVLYLICYTSSLTYKNNNNTTQQFINLSR
jgi:hypothetical protein